MSYPVIIRPEAYDEIRGMHKFYQSISNELGDRARNSVSECIDRIRQFPELYASAYGKVRPVPIRQFPYILSYVFEFDRVVVLGLVHSSVPHGTWNRRN
jgi:hypothetical protein